MSLPEVVQAIAELDMALAPMPLKALAVTLDRTMALWRTPATEAVMEFYFEALEEFPAEIIEKALRHVRMTHVYPTMPSPADFRAAALKAAEPLRATLVRARLAKMRLEHAEDLARRRAAPRDPINIPVQVPKPKRLPHELGDSRSDPIDLGDMAARMAEWERRLAD